MNCKKSIYSNTQYALSIFLIVTLLWLTVSTPFIVDAQKKLKTTETSLTIPDVDQSLEENTNPFSGLNEEKGGSSVNGFSEYLTEYFHIPGINQPELIHESYIHGLIYVAHYGELLSPPPEV